MAHWRTYEMKGANGYKWLASARIFRKRGTWAFHANTFLYCEEWGFKTARAALMAARQYGRGQLL
jgi:hypothetical protein